MALRKKDPKTTIRRVQRVQGGTIAKSDEDFIAVEEPLEIRVHDEPVAVTMRTPGDDHDLAAGFLTTEGIVHSHEDIGTIRHCVDEENPELRNVVNVTFTDGVKFDLKSLKRNFYATSSCGICGKAAIENIRTDAPALSGNMKVELQTLLGMSGAMRRSQAVFQKTGGLHAAGVFDSKGTMRILREDIGRHNAVDKVIGAMLLREETPLERHILLVSGRASFEIVQKALMASIPIVCAVSAPSSLAVEFADESSMTLIGFLRGEEMNIYSGVQQ